MAPLLASFVAGERGAWRIDTIDPVIGDSLPPAPFLSVIEGHVTPADATWVLAGAAGHARYTTRDEKAALVAVQAGLGRPEATRASLIPIQKSDAWWELAQDQRRAIFEESSHHIAASMKYLPAIARRLYHSRDFEQPFDFLTWFEYAPEHAAAFDELVATLRATEEWRWVVREAHVRLVTVLG